MGRRPKATRGGPLRTTLSTPSDLSDRLRRIAAIKNLTHVDVMRLAVQQYAECEDTTGPASHIGKLLESTRRFSNYYQTVVAKWRLKRTLEQMEGVSARKLKLEAHSAETYLLRVMAELLQGLGSGDEFLVVTNRQFWENARAAVNEGFVHPPEEWRYLHAQGEAIGRGMRLFRLIVMTDKEISSSKEILEKHSQFLSEVRQNYPDRAGHVKVNIKRISGANSGSAIASPFAYIRRVVEDGNLPSRTKDEGAFLVEPRYNSTPEITELSLGFSRGPTESDEQLVKAFRKFQEIEQDSTPIELVLSKLKSGRRR